jgi:omega-6 fatty acid desaturase (delta-12 desaturase)
MQPNTEKHNGETTDPSWRQVIARYNHPDWRRSVWQLIDSLIPYILLWILMIASLNLSFWLTLALAFPAAGFLIRLFIIFHDYGHGSFFKRRKLNDGLGIFLGVLTFTPYYDWSRAHAVHHKTIGDLDRRGIGDVWTMTVEEYRSLGFWKRLGYRIYRHPVVMFGFGAIYLFLIRNRIGLKAMTRKDRINLIWTNLGILGIALVVSLTVGFKAYVLVQLLILYLASVMGIWLFYVQHQYSGVHWFRHDQWDYKTLALQGSSFYKLPGVLQWFTGSIGFHHVHHLSPRIPNYKLAACHYENRMFAGIKPLTLKASLRSLGLGLWDEGKQQLVGFKVLKRD